MDQYVAELSDRVGALESAFAMREQTAVRNTTILEAVAKAVCGDATTAMNQESMIQTQRRHEADIKLHHALLAQLDNIVKIQQQHETELKAIREMLAQLEPLKRLYWGAVAVFSMVNVPIVLWFLNQYGKTK